MLSYLAGLSLLVGVIAYTAQPDCTELRLGLTYNEIAAGPCKDIGKQATDTLQGQPGDPPGMYPIYWCESQKVMVVGSKRTGRTMGLIKVAQ